jgi:gliding motility-associated-like protein
LNNTGTVASFYRPKGLALDAARKLYIADSFNNEIRTAYTVGYRINKPLPSGLIFNNATGIISGKPNVVSTSTLYTVTAYNAFGSSSFTVDIKVIDSQTITFPPIPDKTVCDLDFDPGATSNSPITYTSSNLSVATIAAGKVDIAGPGITTITASDGFSTSSQTLTVIAGVTPSVTISPATFDECSGIAVTYTATPVNGGNVPHFQWQVNGQNSGPDNSIFISSNLNNNDKVTCILTSSAACTSSPIATSNKAVFKLDPPLSTAVIIVSALTGPVCAGTEIIFTAQPSSPDIKPTYQWQVNGSNAGTNNPSFTSTTLADGDVVTCILTSIGKCLVNSAVQSNAITVRLNPVSQCVIVIPSAFTPNGDGINDLWNISALQGYPYCSISIFTRYGSLIYKSTGYSKAWDGTYNSKALPVGTYYYMVDLKNGKRPLTGPITILR